MRTQRSAPARAPASPLPLVLYEHVSDRGMFLAAGAVEVHQVEEGQIDEVWRVYLRAGGELLPALDLYRRARGTSSFLVGGFAGLKLELHPEPDGAWRLHVAPRQAGLAKDRARPTAVTRRHAPTAPPPGGLNAAALARIGHAIRFAAPDEQRELDLWDFDPPGGPRS
jgi:hypothetical protein